MIFLAILLLLLFTGFFVRETMLSLRRGSVMSRGSTYDRRTRPILFWFGIGAWLLNASVGAVFILALALSRFG